jgi:single-strand DNA-binding protein
MIKLQIIGNLGRDAVVNNVNGKSVINFTVAHTEKYKDAQGVQKDRTTWVDCAYWTDRTAIAPYLKKGTQVYSEGTPDIRTYTTQDGRNAASLTLRVQNVQLLGGRTNENGGENSNTNYQNNNYNNTASANVYTAPVQHQAAPIANDPLDDLPF